VSQGQPLAPVPVSRWVVFLTIAGLGCAIDLATKSWIFGRLGKG